jgi:hypothetical protein
MNWKKRAVMVVLLLATGCGRLVVSEKELGKTLWPLTEPEGTLSCTRMKKRRVVTFINIYGDKYALNEYAKELGYNSIDPIRQTDPTNPSKKKDLSVLREKGERICGPRN